jgi:xanthine dehydrogenase YagS FAD-binding subunit
MKSFKHYNASSVQEASALLAEYKGSAVINAGGTDLLGCLKGKCVPAYPEAVVNIKSIPDLDFIRSNGKELRIGTLAKLADIVSSPEIKRDYSLLAEAVSAIASPNIRNMATIGGNLAQEVRCWYYRYPRQIGGPVVCLRKGGKKCSALVGDNRYHSIFGGAFAMSGSKDHIGGKDTKKAGRSLNRGCLAVTPSELAAVLVTQNAGIITSKRRIPAEAFFVATDFRSNVLESDEIIVEVRIPKPPREARQRYLRFTLRKPIDFAIVSVASTITETDGVCSDARITLGAVAPAPVRAIAAEEVIKGKQINEDVAIKAAQAALADAWPLRMNGYKVDIARTLVKRAILDTSD